MKRAEGQSRWLSGILMACTVVERRATANGIGQHQGSRNRRHNRSCSRTSHKGFERRHDAAEI
jgi:hypothetical protein